MSYRNVIRCSYCGVDSHSGHCPKCWKTLHDGIKTCPVCDVKKEPEPKKAVDADEPDSDPFPTGVPYAHCADMVPVVETWHLTSADTGWDPTKVPDLVFYETAETLAKRLNIPTLFGLKRSKPPVRLSGQRIRPGELADAVKKLQELERYWK